MRINLDYLEKTLNNKITVYVGLVLADSTEDTEYIQGILANIDKEKDEITIKQHFTYYDFLDGKETKTALRVLKNGVFKVVSVLRG